MSGLSLPIGGYGGVGTGSQPSMGSQAGYDTVTSAAFGPGVTLNAPGNAETLKPNDGFGIAVWTGIGAIIALLVIRHSLPR
jgi:hypothetical protein